MKPKKPTNSLDAYQRLARHERSLWLTTIAIVLMTGATVAVLTAGASLSGVFAGTINGYLLAGGCLLLLSVFMGYLVHNRQTLEQNRHQILRELESRSSQLSEANQTLQQALRTREDLLNGVSHELKTPLTAMIAYAEFLSDESLSPDESRQHVDTILAEGRSLLRLIGQLVDVSSLQSGLISLRWDRGDLVAVLGAVCDRIRGEADPQVILDVELSADPVELWFDSARTSQAVEILLRDALANARPGTQVSLRVRTEGNDWIAIEIEDPLRGISPEACLALFTPFARIDMEPSGRSGDLGLSLPLAQRLIMAHGGLVRAEAGTPGGLTLHILLPRDNAARQETEPGSGIFESLARAS